MKAFTTDYLEKVVEPCDWLALWCTDGFDVLVEVRPSCYFVKDVAVLYPQGSPALACSTALHFGLFKIHYFFPLLG